MMTDREVWVSAFIAAFSGAMQTNGCALDGAVVDGYTFAKAVADKVLKDAPEDKP